MPMPTFCAGVSGSASASSASAASAASTGDGAGGGFGAAGFDRSFIRDPSEGGFALRGAGAAGAGFGGAFSGAASARSIRATLTTRSASPASQRREQKPDGFASRWQFSDRQRGLDSASSDAADSVEPIRDKPTTADLPSDTASAGLDVVATSTPIARQISRIFVEPFFVCLSLAWPPVHKPLHSSLKRESSMIFFRQYGHRLPSFSGGGSSLIESSS
mmetsp:Transcript_7998/g.24393  ORF Transcript_7998/g.24393 Transcript_7998/m.24393 type:complete len:218 (+) Transcript_7998:511-1164(+)